MKLNVVVEATPDPKNNIYIYDTIIADTAFNTLDLKTYDTGGKATDNNTDDDDNIYAGDDDTGYTIEKPPGVNEIVVKDPNGDVVATAPLPPGSPTNLPVTVYLKDNILTVVYNGITIITYIIPDTVYNAWNLSTVYVGFVDSSGNPIPTPEGSTTDYIVSQELEYSSRITKISSLGWWSPNVSRATTLRQYDIVIYNDDSVKVYLSLDDKKLLNARVVYRGGYDHSIPYDDVLLICEAGFSSYIGVKNV